MKPTVEEAMSDDYEDVPVDVTCRRPKGGGNPVFVVRRKNGRLEVLDRYCVVEDQHGIVVAVHSKDRVTNGGGLGLRVLRLGAYIFGSKAGIPVTVVDRLLKMKQRDKKAAETVRQAARKMKGNTSDIQDGVRMLASEFGGGEVLSAFEDFAEDPEEYAWDVFLEAVDSD